MAKSTVELLQDGAIEVAEKKLMQFWRIAQSASKSEVEEPTPEQFNAMATQMVTSQDNSFETPDGKRTTYEQIKKEARELLKHADLTDEEKKEYLNQLAAKIPNTAELGKMADVAKETEEAYDNWGTKLQYAFKGFVEMVQTEGFFAALGELFKGLIAMFTGDMSFGKIGDYGRELAAKDIQSDVQSRLHELSKTPGMEGVLNTETIGKIGEKAKEKALHPDAEEVVTTAEQRLGKTNIIEFGDMAEKGIEAMVDAKLGDAVFLPKFKDKLEEFKTELNSNSALGGLFNVKSWVADTIGDDEIRTIRDTIKDPLKALLTNENLNISDSQKLKEQVAELVKQELKADKETGAWKIINNAEALDMIANSIADEVVQNREMLAKAHGQMHRNPSDPIKGLNRDGDKFLTLEELATYNKNNDQKLERSEIDAMPEELKKRFDELLAKNENAVAVTKQGEHVESVDFAKLPPVGNGKSPGLQIG